MGIWMLSGREGTGAWDVSCETDGGRLSSSMGTNAGGVGICMLFGRNGGGVGIWVLVNESCWMSGIAKGGGVGTQALVQWLKFIIIDDS